MQWQVYLQPVQLTNVITVELTGNNKLPNQFWIIYNGNLKKYFNWPVKARKEQSTALLEEGIL